MNEDKQVKLANSLSGFIGAKLERIHVVPQDDVHYILDRGYKSVVFCFSNGKTIHFDAT